MASANRARIVRSAASIGVLERGAHGAPRILSVLCNRQISASQVAALIGNEPALYARVLRVANSAYYRQSRSISTIERAIVLLGLDAVRGIAAAACLDRTLPRNRENLLLDLKSVLQHSVTAAVAAEMIANLLSANAQPEAFIAGLLHNLGMIVQIDLDAAAFEAMIGMRRAGDSRPVRALETSCGVVPHEQCVAVMFEEWKLPPNLIAAAGHHHDPMEAPAEYRSLAALIHLGADLALRSGSVFALEPAPGARDERATHWLGLADEQFVDVLAELPPRVAELKRVLLEG